MQRTTPPVLLTPKQVADLNRAHQQQPAVIRPRGAQLLASIVGRTLPKKEGS